jgi:iron complex outermembrane receptor protein
MNNSSVSYLRKPLALLGAGLSLFAANAAFGQTTAAAPASTDDTVKLEKYTVTGSFLPVSATVNASPVLTIKSSDIGQSGATDPLRLLRQVTPLFAGSGNQGTEANNGAAGESYVALRNLTTLVLINGQRLVGSPFTSGTLVDLNTVPTAMIDRIEILKDGASTIYGTDAIGGVVNIILKKDYNGAEMGVRYGSTSNGDYKTREAYLIGGASGNGYSITMGAQHFENIPLFTTSRPLTTLSGAAENAMGFNVTSAVFSGTYPGRVGSFVLAGSTLIATGATGFNAAITNPGIKSSPNDTSLTGGFTGAAAFTFLQNNGTYLRVSTTPAGIAVGGSATALNTTLFDNPLIENTKRNQFFVNFSKELVGKNLEVFGDFLYSQTVNGGSGLAPSPIPGVGPGGGNSLFIPANNPYNVFNIDFPGALSARVRTIELGKRTSINETNTWRFVAGLKGEINDKYNWEAIYNYSRASQLQRILGGVNGANMNAAMIPLIDSDTGGYVYNAAGKPLSTLTDSTGTNVPVYNFFALPGFNDPATLNLLKTTLYSSGDATLRNIQFILRGRPFELPAGEVGFALGAETRAEDLSGSVDALFANGLALGYNPANPFSGGSRSSKGAFLEVGVPVTSAKQNIPGFYKVDLNLADRYEEIQPGGNANSPKVGLTWMPFDDSFVLRGTYSKGFIAPAIISLFGPSVGNSPALQILEGDGSAGSGGSLGNLTTIQINANQLSNPLLPSSKSTSYTLGFVYSPKQVKGLTFSADYYHIAQDGVGGFDYTAIAADLNAKGSGSIYASGFVFADNTKLTTATPNQVTSTNFGFITVRQNPLGDQWTSGLDLSVDYNFKTASMGQFDVGAQANVLFNYYARTSPIAPYIQYANNFSNGTNGIGFANGLLPNYIIKPYVNHTYGPLMTSLFLNYVPSVRTTGDLTYTTGGTDPDTISGKPYYVPSYFTADLTFSYTVPNFGHDWARNLTVTVGANNLFNKNPPYVPVDGNPPGENNTVEAQYDIIGRFFFIEVKKAF